MGHGEQTADGNCPTTPRICLPVLLSVCLSKKWYRGGGWWVRAIVLPWASPRGRWAGCLGRDVDVPAELPVRGCGVGGCVCLHTGPSLICASAEALCWRPPEQLCRPRRVRGFCCARQSSLFPWVLESLGKAGVCGVAKEVGSWERPGGENQVEDRKRDGRRHLGPLILWVPVAPAVATG